MGLINSKLFPAAVVSLAATFFISAHAATRYVSPSGSQVSPYTSWATAARIIQDAVDAAVDGDEIVVTNGTYFTGGRAVAGTNFFGTNLLVSRVAVDKQLVLRSVNGPRVTIIDGQRSVRCAALASNAVLSGFTLTNGFMNRSGGGVFCESQTTIVSNCTLSGNVASGSFGGGAYGGTLANCTLTGNSAMFGGGAYGADLRNCIVYYNSGPVGNYDSSSTLNNCCTTPIPATGTNNLSAEPQLAGAWHLAADSPCIGKGSYTAASGLDIDGETWADPPSIGCNEFWSGSATGALSVALSISYTNVAVGFAVNFEAQINGLVSASVWDFGDGVVVSNRPYASHAWATTGTHSVVLRAYNDDYPAGLAAAGTVQVLAQPVHYVVASGNSSSAPYSSWASAASTIQQAVDAATVPGALVLVSNGVYQASGRAVYNMSNRLAVTRPVTVKSVNGAAVTTIVGYRAPGTTNSSAAMRCVYLTNGAVLSGFTLTNGATQVSGDQYRQMSGGAVYCELGGAVVSNCVLTGNSASSRGGGACFGSLINCTLTGGTANFGGGAFACALSNCVLRGNSASYGGGAYFGTLDSCILTNNSAVPSGGGAYSATLNNCALIGNSAVAYAPYGAGAYGCALNNCTVSSNSASGTWPYGGGAYSGIANNSILYFNNASNGPNYYFSGQSAMNYCCTTPDPAAVGIITSEPLFVDFAAGNLRLQSNSPCINSGNNDILSGATDLDANPRIVGGTVDIGAYEFQVAASPFSTWLQQHGLPTDGSADFLDSDHDGLNNWQEWVADTDPTNSLSVFKIMSATTTNNPAGTFVTWTSQNTRLYYLERSVDLAQSAFSTIQDNIVGQAGTTSYTDTNAAGPGPFFYRVGVRSP